ncbi:MAG: methyltransferase domain-containing protein [Magnetococcales bacterium]|nr:methyltransferase domain-containing protein [Magnetococcales bacterium]
MKNDHVHVLRCVECGGSLDLRDATLQDDVVISGRLGCQQCDRVYPVIATVAVCFRRNVLHDYLEPFERDFILEQGWQDCLTHSEGGHDPWHQKQKDVSDNWSYQWGLVAKNMDQKDFSGRGYHAPEAFWNFVRIPRESVSGKTVLVTCGGFGREAYHLVAAGAETVFFNEIGVEIYQAAKLIPDAGRKLVLLRSDAIHLPLADHSVAFAICDHALQHIPMYTEAFRKLVALTQSGGKTIICVYSWENNFLMTHCVDPSKKVLHKINLKVLRFLALPITAMVFLAAHGFYAPLGRFLPNLGRKLPLFEHMIFWSQFPFPVLWISIFDLLHAPVSHHFRREEVEKLALDNDLVIEELHNTNGSLWSLVGIKP